MRMIHTATQRLRRAALGLGLLLSLLVLPMRGAEVLAKNPHDLIAGFLHRFPAYVEWPTNAFATNPPPWRIAVLGDDPFGEALAMACKNKPIKGREFEIVHVMSVLELPACDIVYLTSKDPDELKAQLAALATRPVLTVGEAPDFLKLGGIIQLEARRTMQFNINLDVARTNGLKIRVEMLEIATHIIEHGEQKK